MNDTPQGLPTALTDFYGPPIHIVTRAQLIADGDLIPVDPTLCTEAGISLPVALTRTAHAALVHWTDEDNDRQRTVQDATGRLWDVLTMAAHAMRRHPDADTADVTLYVVPRNGHSWRPRLARAVARLGADDQGHPVLTITLPTED